jgi:hypothetical protein
MTPMRSITLMRSAALGAALVLVTLSGTAQAQDSDAPLKGPKVKDTGVPGENRKFGEGGGQRERMEARVPHRLFVRAFDVLKSDDAAADVRLTDAQETSLKKIDDGFKAEVQAFQKEHRDEVTALRDQLPPQERRRIDAFLNGGRPQGDAKRGGEGRKGKPEGDAKKATSEEAEAARSRLREIMADAPKPADSHAAMFAVLTESQRPLVTKELERLQGEAKKREGQGAGAGDREQMRERLKNLPPEERERVLREMREKRQGEGKGKPADADDPMTPKDPD